MEWMLDIQLGRRNLSPIQRIAIAEKYRSLYEKQAKENLIKAGSNYGIGKEKPLPNLVNPISTVDTTKKLADVAGVSEKTYRMGAKILNSDNEEVKEKVLSGEMGNGRDRPEKDANMACLSLDKIAKQLCILRTSKILSKPISVNVELGTQIL